MSEQSNNSGPRLEDDFFTAINYEWLQQAEIPADRPAFNAFVELDQDIEKLLMDTTAAWAAGDKELPEDPKITEFVRFYEMTSNTAEREELGAVPAQPLLEKTQALTGWEDVSTNYKDLMYEGISVPYELGVSIDMKYADKHALYASAPDLILPDRTYYEGARPEAEALLEVWSGMALQLLSAHGFSPEEAQELVDGAKEFDALIAPYTKSSVEAADYVKMYNPVPFDEFTAASQTVDLDKAVQDLVEGAPEYVVVTEPEFFKHFSSITAEENFEAYKSWAVVNVVLGSSAYLTDELRVVGGVYSRALSGIAEPLSWEKHAYRTAYSPFSMAVGDWYGKKYFGAQAKADVEEMVQSVIGVYQKRLADNDWLGEKTKELAIKKLSAVEVHVGYPERLPDYLDEFHVTKSDQGGTILSNIQEFNKIALADNFSKLNKPVERDLWAMSPAMVNAYYSPNLNTIVFPAAILQPPFYDLEQPRSANFGGIGAVIAHEISHAFDNNGSQFDDKGGLAQWWTKEDLANFEAKAEDMVVAFDGMETPGGPLDGKLTVSENIADAGGLSAALAAAKSEPDYDARAFFEGWARTWRFIASDEYARMLIAIDVHSPAIARVNGQVRLLDEFYETYNIQPGDGMYLKPEKRAAIW